jgi:serine/threonine protein kinase
MFCNYCGSPNPDDGRFCAVCGKGLMPTAPSAGTNPPRFANTEMGLQADFVLMNRYAIRREIGAGGMGQVYLADDKILRIPVAIKVLREILSRDPGSVQRLKKEAKLAIQLSHPNIVRVHDYHETDIVRFLVMEYIDGETLAHRVARENLLVESEVRRIALAICSGLEYAHEKRIIHRDLKPGNLLLGKDGSIKIADFGIARVCRDSMSRLTSQLDSGTLIYMSPEQLMGESTERSDIYSLGVVLYELLSGEVPFHSGDIQAQIREKIPRPLPGISREMNELVLRCLVKNPQGRPRNVRQLREWFEGKHAPTIAPIQESIGTSEPAKSEAPKPMEFPVGQPSARTSQSGTATIPASTPRQDSPQAARVHSGRSPAPHLALRGALGFGLGVIPAAACLEKYEYPYTEHGYLALAFVALIAWGALGALAMKLDRRSVTGFIIGFMPLSTIVIAIFALHPSAAQALLLMVGGLMVAAATASSIMRKGARFVLAAGAIFGFSFLMTPVLRQQIAGQIWHEHVLTVTSALYGAIAGGLFGWLLQRRGK